MEFVLDHLSGIYNCEVGRRALEHLRTCDLWNIMNMQTQL